MSKTFGSIWNLWDLHNHTDASDGKMACEQLVDNAVAKGIKCIAITDHHTAKNVDEAKRIGAEKGLHVIAGIEFRTEYGQKSVHIIGLFPDRHVDTILDSKNLYELVLCPLGLSEAVIIQKGKEVTVYKIGKFTFDTQRQVLFTDDRSDNLTTKQSELLSLLCAHLNEILERNFALKTIWIDDNYFNARSMDVYITKLRKHLKEDSQIEIINIHGKGYKLITPEDE